VEYDNSKPLTRHAPAASRVKNSYMIDWRHGLRRHVNKEKRQGLHFSSALSHQES
jgi:hypothetical protein